MSPPMAELEQFQRWMQAVITHPDGAAPGIASSEAQILHPVTADTIETVCEPSKQLCGLDRIGIYAGMYYSRLVDVLEQDFPAVKHAMGDTAFEATARMYVQEHPSTHFNLNVFGRSFAPFIRDELEAFEQQRFVVELADLQWAMQEVFDAPRIEPISMDTLLSVPEKVWAGTRLHLGPAYRLFAFAYPVNAFLQAYRDGDEPALPQLERTWVLVHRKQYQVWREDLTAAEFALLDALRDQRSLGEALEAATQAPGADPNRVMDEVGHWFRRWAGAGLFAGVELPPE